MPEKKEARKVSLVITVIINSVTQEEASAIEDAIRDVADDYSTAQVNATRGAERPSLNG